MGILANYVSLIKRGNEKATKVILKRMNGEWKPLEKRIKSGPLSINSSNNTHVDRVHIARLLHTGTGTREEITNESHKKVPAIWWSNKVHWPQSGASLPARLMPLHITSCSSGSLNFKLEVSGSIFDYGVYSLSLVVTRDKNGPTRRRLFFI